MVCFVSVCNINIYLKWWLSSLSLGTVWLTLPTFYSPVALSKCRSSRGNVLVLQSWSQSPQTGLRILSLSSGLTPLPQTLCPPCHPPIPWQLAWLLLLTADTTFHELLPPPPSHTLSLITIIPHSHVAEEQVLINWNLYLNVCLSSIFSTTISCRHYFVCNCLNKHTFHLLSPVWCHRENEQSTQAVLCSLTALQTNTCS